MHLSFSNGFSMNVSMHILRFSGTFSVTSIIWCLLSQQPVTSKRCSSQQRLFVSQNSYKKTPQPFFLIQKRKPANSSPDQQSPTAIALLSCCFLVPISDTITPFPFLCCMYRSFPTIVKGTLDDNKYKVLFLFLFRGFGLSANRLKQ